MPAMARRLRSLLRSLAFAAGFTVFGALCVLVTVFAFPVLLCLGGSREQRELRAQRVIAWGFRVFMSCVRALDIAEIHATGLERLRAPGAHLLVANHPTLIDVCVIGTLVDQLDCVAKRAAWSNPFMLGIIRATGYIANDDGPALLEAGAERLAQGRSLLLFPEGTRSPAEGLHPFRRGAAHLALRTGLPILPIFLTCEPRGLMKGSPWWQATPSRMKFRVEIGEPLHVKELAVPGEPRSRTARRATAALRDLYVKRLHSGA